MKTVNVIHSRSGRIGAGTDTSPSDIDRLVEAIRTDSRAHLAIHFHGGLVSKDAGMKLAKRLSPIYLESAFPVFYVWESGFFETMRNNLSELASEPVFKNLVRKLIEYGLKYLGSIDGSRAIVPGTIDPREVRQAVELHWAAASQSSVPYRDFVPAIVASGVRSSEMQIDIAELQADLEGDSELACALDSLPDLMPNSRGAMLSQASSEHRSTFSEAVKERFCERQGARGVIAWIKVASMIKNIVSKILERYAKGRDHGLYATVVEELLRECKLGGSGINEWGKALQWNRMKQDTAEAFHEGDDLYAGTALQSRLGKLIESGAGPKRITLIGHSTGAIYIANWLAAAEKYFPTGVRFDIVFLAPAITYAAFDNTLQMYGDRIGHFRMFAMRDSIEREDQVWGYDSALDGKRDWRSLVYPSSLLYLVSGLLESKTSPEGEIQDEPDMPLMGLERHFIWENIYSPNDFPEVARVRTWLNAGIGRTVWSKTVEPLPGLNSHCIDHGAFDDDEQTLQSLEVFLRS